MRTTVERPGALMGSDSTRQSRRGSTAVGIVGILTGAVGIAMAYWLFPYLAVVRQTGQVSSGGFFLVFWSVDATFWIAIIFGGVALIATGLLLLILLRRDARPKLRKAVLALTLVGNVLMLGAATYQLVVLEQFRGQAEQRLPD